MKKNVALWIVTLLLSLLFVVMFAVAMVEKWGFGVIAWLVLGAVDAWLLRQFFKKSADPAKPTEKK